MSITPDIEEVPSDLEAAARFYDRGLFRRAWDTLAAAGGIGDTSHPARGLFHSRLCGQLGRRSESRRTILRLWRRHRTHPGVIHHFGWHLLELRGPAHTRDFQLRHPLPADAPAPRRADALLQEAEVLCLLRDFARARACIEEAESLAPGLRWLAVTRGRLLAAMDLQADVLAHARAAAAGDPSCWHLAAIEAEALVALGRDDEALDGLQRHACRFEAPFLIAQWADLEFELEHADRADEALRRFEAVLPPRPADDGGDEMRQWLAARRADTCWMRGDAAGAASWAARAGDASSFQGRFAARLAQPPPHARRTVLPVGFTRQKHLTCAPATLATLCRYWRRPAPHEAIAESICYDGTPGHRARAWAEEQGWAVREFTVTAASARALIDRGFPFALTTVMPGNAHAQAVIGYDDFRGTLLIRDPLMRSKTEWIEDAAYAAQAPYGPRAMVLAPPDEAGRIDAVPLEDAPAYDRMFALDRALDRHDRTAAAEAAGQLLRERPDHRVAALARLTLAEYDQQPSGAVAALRAHLDRHPADVNAVLRLHAWRSAEAPRESRLAEWRSALASPASHPLLWIEFAKELSDDARRGAEARRWLHRASRRLVRGAGLEVQADLLWTAGRYDEALEWYRIASCLEEFNEDFALAYFRRARARGRTDEALEWLRARAQAHGTRGSAPWHSWAQALAELDRMDDSLDALEEGLRRRPGDFAHRVRTAEAMVQAGRPASARALLAERPEGVHLSSWHSAMALLEEKENGPGAAVEHWDAAWRHAPLEIRPLAGLLRTLEATAGREAALARLREAAAAHPHYRPLQRFALEWLARVSAEQQESLLVAYLEREPDDAWAWRELSFARTRQARGEEALAAARRAAEIEPRHPSAMAAQADALFQLGRREEGMSALREALHEAIDYPYAIELALLHSHDAASRKELIAFLRGEIIRQHTTGEALSLFADLAAPHLHRQELLDLLRAAHGARPDLWRTGDCLARHLARMGRGDEALVAARDVVREFPMLPGPRATLASLLHHAGRRDEERAVIDEALAIDASWDWFHRQSALLWEEAEDAARAAAILDRLLARSPLDPVARLARARLAWKLGDRPAAIRMLTELVAAEPGHDDAWNALAFMGRETGDPGLAPRLARELVRKQPNEARSWLVLAAQLGAPADFEERLHAYGRAAELNPTLVRAVEEKALLLCEAGRIEEALALVRDPRWGSPRPPMLRTREAWILGQLGKTEAALPLVEEALTDDPTLYQARLWAIDWSPKSATHERALKHATELTLQYPNDADAWCALGEVQAKLPDRQRDAARSFERALVLDPRSRRAFARLFDMDLSSDRLDRAARRLERASPHLSAVAALGFRMELALHGDSLPAFLDALHRLVLDPGDEPVWFTIALDRLADARKAWAMEACRKTMEALRDGTARNPESAAFAARLQPTEPGALLPVLQDRPDGDELARRGYSWILSLMGESSASRDAGRRGRTRFRDLVAQRQAWFRSDRLLWGQVGYAMVNLRMHSECVDWLADWRRFPDIEPWIVNNLVISQLVTGDKAGARATVRDALNLPRFDDTIMRFHLLESLWLWLEERPEESRRHLGLVNRAVIADGFDGALLRIADWLSELTPRMSETLELTPRDAERWAVAKAEFGQYPVLVADLDAVKNRIEQAAGRRMPSPPPPASSQASRGTPNWVLIAIAVYVVLHLLRTCVPPH